PRPLERVGDRALLRARAREGEAALLEHADRGPELGQRLRRDARDVAMRERPGDERAHGLGPEAEAVRLGHDRVADLDLALLRRLPAEAAHADRAQLAVLPVQEVPREPADGVGVL